MILNNDMFDKDFIKKFLLIVRVATIWLKTICTYDIMHLNVPVYTFNMIIEMDYRISTHSLVNHNLFYISMQNNLKIVSIYIVSTDYAICTCPLHLFN
jgi:hypothetical protein